MCPVYLVSSTLGLSLAEKGKTQSLWCACLGSCDTWHFKMRVRMIIDTTQAMLNGVYMEEADFVRNARRATPRVYNV